MNASANAFDLRSALNLTGRLLELDEYIDLLPAYPARWPSIPFDGETRLSHWPVRRRSAAAWSCAAVVSFCLSSLRDSSKHREKKPNLESGQPLLHTLLCKLHTIPATDSVLPPLSSVVFLSPSSCSFAPLTVQCQAHDK